MKTQYDDNRIVADVVGDILTQRNSPVPKPNYHRLIKKICPEIKLIKIALLFIHKRWSDRRCPLTFKETVLQRYPHASVKRSFDRDFCFLVKHGAIRAIQVHHRQSQPYFPAVKQHPGSKIKVRTVLYVNISGRRRHIIATLGKIKLLIK